MKMTTTLTTHTSPAADEYFKICKKILVYPEKHQTCISSSMVVDVAGRMVSTQAQDGS